MKDTTKVNEKAIKAAGAAGVIRPGKTSVQVIIGTQVQFVADELAGEMIVGGEPGKGSQCRICGYYSVSRDYDIAGIWRRTHENNSCK